MDEDVGILDLGDHLVGVGDEIGADVAAVELHAFHDFQFGVEALGLFDRDHAFVADLLHRLGDHLADGGVAVGGNGADLGDLVVRLDLLRTLLEIGDDGFDRLVDAALDVHGIHAGGNRLGAFAHDRLRQYGGGGGAVAREVVGLRGHFAHHLGAHVLEFVGEFDFLGDGHAVLGGAGRAEALLDHHIAALGAEGDFHRIGQNVDAAQHLLARIGAEFYVFSSHCCIAPEIGLPSVLFLDGLFLDDAHDVGLLHDQEFFAGDFYLGARPFAEQHPVARLDFRGNPLAVFVARTRADRNHFALLRLFLRGVGDDDAAGGLLILFDAANDHSVAQRTEIHGY